MESKVKKSGLGTFAKKYGTLFAFAIICLYFGIATPVFFTTSNMLTVLRQISMLAVLGAGMTVVMITGRIDLSAGYGTSILGILAGALMVNYGVPVWAAALLVLAAGALIGLLNGVLTSYVGIPDFICTLAVGYLLSGLNQAYTKGHPISGIPDGFKIFGNTTWFGIPSMIFFMAIWLFIIMIVLEKTRFGRHTYAIGGNKEAALMSGVNVRFDSMLGYVFSGLGMALTALILTSRMGSAHVTAGDSYNLQGIATVYLGATAFKEGEPNLLGTLLGALIPGVLKNGMTHLNIEYFYQDIAQGIVILIAVAITSLQRAHKK